jgi:hypothetical protein
MRNLLAFLAAVTLTVVIAGWYLNWYSIHSMPASDGHHKLSIDINTVKVGADVQKGSTSFWNFLEKARKPDTTSEVKSEAPSEVKAEAPKKDADGGKKEAPKDTTPPPSK